MDQFTLADVASLIGMLVFIALIVALALWHSRPAE